MGRLYTEADSVVPQPRRVAAYIDGYNFYHGMMAKDWKRYRWLDYVALVKRFVRAPDQLVSVKYFTSPVTHEPSKMPRQTTYLRALSAHGEIDTFHGAFELRDVRCGKCNQWYKRPQEKQTDVSIATQLVSDAYEERFDQFMLVSADSDLVPAVQFVMKRFGAGFVLIDPPRRHSDDLARLADAHLHVAPSVMRQCQLPDPVEYRTPKGRTKRYYRPPEWGPANSDTSN